MDLKKGGQDDGESRGRQLRSLVTPSCRPQGGRKGGMAFLSHQVAAYGRVIQDPLGIPWDEKPEEVSEESTREGSVLRGPSAEQDSGMVCVL